MKRYLFKLLKISFAFLALFAVLLLPRQVIEAQVAGITSPGPGQTISGIVIVQGTASSDDFLRYELAFLRDDDPATGWIVFADGDQPVFDGTLVVWDTTVGQNVNAPVFPDGSYQLRLRVVRSDFNFDEYFAGNLLVQNGTAVEVATQEPLPPPPTETPLPTEEAVLEPTPEPVDGAPTAFPAEGVATPDVEQVPTQEVVPEQPTEVPTEIPTPAPTSTPLPTREAPTVIPTIVLETLEPAPEVLPTLTAFPSPTPVATTEQAAFSIAVGPEEEGDSAESETSVNGALETVFGYDYSQFGSAFGTGFRWALIGFALVGIYLLVRFVVRWLWQTISSNW